MQLKNHAQHLASLHVKGQPLVLYNAWDAGSAKAIVDAGAQVVGTSSWAVAAAHGYDDGELIPFEFVEKIIGRIVQAVSVPVTVDVEGGFSTDPDISAELIGRLMDLGVVGINIEDRVVGGTGLHDVAFQGERIAAIRRMADERNVPLFINARTDVFFAAGIPPQQVLADALTRAAAYAKAGASGLFVPGLVDTDVIAALCAGTALPVNVMVMAGLADTRELASAGVARISHGPGPYLHAMDSLRQNAKNLLG